MAKPREKTGSTAPRPIAPPPISQHLRDLASHEYDPDNPASSRRRR
jgi:hypothetical protein